MVLLASTLKTSATCLCNGFARPCFDFASVWQTSALLLKTVHRKLTPGTTLGGLSETRRVLLRQGNKKTVLQEWSSKLGARGQGRRKRSQLEGGEGGQGLRAHLRSCRKAGACMEPPHKRLRLAVDAESCPTCRGLEEPCTTPGSCEELGSPAVGGTETVRRIHSVERVLCSQTLNTPPNPAWGGMVWHSTKAAEDDFKISYSQTYARHDAHAQRACSPSRAQAAAGKAAQEGAAAGRDAGEAAAPAAGPSRRQPGAPSRHSLTPELVGEDQLVSHSAGGAARQASRKLFPIFRPVSQWKTVHIIRHGESEYNAATNAGKDFKDPQIFNPKLTEKGQRQARQLRARLEKMGKLDGALWVSSPLTRAIETMLLSCPKAHLVRPDVSAAGQGGELKVMIRHELTEHLVTTGDIGLPATWLLRRFPELQGALAAVPERWWFAASSNDAITREFNKSEPKRAFQERVGDFRRWVQAQQEQVIVAYGHSSMIKELSGRRLKNCEVITMHM